MPGWRLRKWEREEISRELRAGASIRSIARRLGRAPSTISREVNRNGGRDDYRGYLAWRVAERRARRPKVPKLVANRALAEVVEQRLMQRWSPAQIAGRLRREHPDDPSWWVSPETIYQSLYVQGRGGLRKELTRALRTGRSRRRPRGGRPRGSRIPNMVNIADRPADVDDRAVPGHWEGDLIEGAFHRSFVATLVERTSRYLMLVELPDGKSASHVADALATNIVKLPEQLRRSLTWDQGREMAAHEDFTIATGVDVYFCDPASPWQRATNENTNGLIRQYLPKRTDLSRHNQHHLDTIATELNQRPRKTLQWMTPSEKLAEIVATTD